MSAILETIWHGFVAATWMAQTATVLGLLGVWLATRQSLWTFPVGLVQVVLIGIVFFGERLYADAFLQSVYFMALVYGWWRWTHPGDYPTYLPVSRLSRKRLLGLVVCALLVTIGWGELLSHLDDAMPWRDAFIATFGILSQWLEANKKIEAWAGWVSVNAAGVIVYAALGLYWFVVLYSLYLMLSFVGLHKWHVSYRQEVAA